MTPALRPPAFLSSLDDSIELNLSKMPVWRQELLYSPPVRNASQTELYRDAAGMTEVGMSFEEQRTVLLLRFEDYYREIETREVENAIRSASGSGNSPDRSERLPLLNERIRQDALKDTPFPTVAAMKLASRVKTPWGLTSENVLDRFFFPDELICMAETKKTARTLQRHRYRGREERLPFVVPNVMTAQWGENAVGRRSSRCNSIVGPLRHLVIEFDTGTLDEQAALIGNIAQHGVPLMMVLWSGGKSLHSWFDITKLAEEERYKLQRYAVAIGADRATFVPCQLCRTPNAIRTENGNKQAVWLLNATASLEGRTL